MKARLPQGRGGGPTNMQGMIKQAQKMQEDMAALQEDLDAREYDIKAGGGAVCWRQSFGGRRAGICERDSAAVSGFQEAGEEIYALEIPEKRRRGQVTNYEPAHFFPGGENGAQIWHPRPL